MMHMRIRNKLSWDGFVWLVSFVWQWYADDYVYDFYTVNEEVDMTTVDASSPFPLLV